MGTCLKERVTKDRAELAEWESSLLNAQELEPKRMQTELVVLGRCIECFQRKGWYFIAFRGGAFEKKSIESSFFAISCFMAMIKTVGKLGHVYTKITLLVGAKIIVLAVF